MKKLVLFVLVLVFALTAAAVPAFASGDNLSLTIDVPAQVEVGQDYTATVYINNPDGKRLSAFRFEISAEPGLELKSVTEDYTVVPRRDMMTSNVNGDGLGIIAYAGSEGVTETRWSPCTVTFTATKSSEYLDKELKINVIATMGSIVEGSSTTPISVSFEPATASTTPHCEHEFGPEQEVTAATCGKPGTSTQECSVCGYVKTINIPATGKHTYTTYQNNDEEHWQECDVCGEATEHVAHTLKTVDNGETHSAECSVCVYKAAGQAHHYGAWTDSGDGKHHKQVCDICGHVNEQEHTFDANTWSVDAQKKTHYHECTTCGARADEAEHHYDATESTGRCWEVGKTTFTCSVCKDHYDVEGEKNAHVYGPPEVKKAATCTTPGEQVLKCTKECCQNLQDPTNPDYKDVNGDLPVKTVTIEPLGHTFEKNIKDDQNSKAPTYLEDGVDVFLCDRHDQEGCTGDNTKKVPVPKLALPDGLVTVDVPTTNVPDFVNNKTAMKVVSDAVNDFVKQYAETGTPGSGMSEDFVKAVTEALNKAAEEAPNGKVEIVVSVDFTEITATDIPEGIAAAAKAGDMSFEAARQLSITATVNGEPVSGNIMNALPTPAEYALSKPEYAKPIGVMFTGTGEDFEALPFTKNGETTTSTASAVGVYALYSTSDIAYADSTHQMSATYTGSEIKPAVEFTINGGEKIPAEYFDVTYANNTQVGTATITVTLNDAGKAAGYTGGPLTFEFEIVAAPTQTAAPTSGTGKSVPDTGDETNVALYAAVLVLSLTALTVVLGKKRTNK